MTLARMPLPPGDVWSPVMPRHTGSWWMISMECEGKPDLVTIEDRSGVLWVVDAHIGTLALQDFHNGLTELLWQPAQF